MPGIAGMVSPLERDALPAILSRMVAAARPEGGETRFWTGNGLGLGVFGPQAPAMLAERSDCVLALTGRVIADGTLAHRLRMAPGARSPERMPQCLLDLYLRLGPQGLEGLNGIYAAAIWDEPRECLTIISDRYGMEPLYYWQQGSRFVFASRQRAVAAHPRFNHRVDPVAVLDLLAAEQMLDERTLFADARAVPPAARLTFQEGQLTIESYWQPALYAPGGLDIEEDEALDGLADRVIAAVSRQLSTGEARAAILAPEDMPVTGPNIGSPVTAEHHALLAAEDPVFEPDVSAGPVMCLLLTGGLDSRLLAGALSRSADPALVWTATIGHERARDARYGAEIARVVGLPHALLPSNPRYLADFAAECVRRTEGGINVHASWILGASAYLRKNNIPAVMTGVGAEAVSGRHWLSEQPLRTRAEALEALCQGRWTYSRAAALLRAELRDDAFAASRESLQHTIEAAPSDDLLGWADYFAYRQSRRHPSGSILSDDAMVLEPFFDNELVDFAYRLPPAVRGSGSLYKKMIINRFPELAVIGYTDSGHLLNEELSGMTPLQRARSWFEKFQRRATRRIARQMPFLGLPVVSDNPGHAVYYNTWLRGPSREYVTNLLAREDLYGDLLDVARVRKLVDDHMSGRADTFRLVDAVLTFALWRQETG